MIVKVENSNGDEILSEGLQTYIEIDNSVDTIQQQQIMIMGNVVKGFSKLSKLPVEGQFYISACLKLGKEFVNH